MGMRSDGKAQQAPAVETSCPSAWRSAASPELGLMQQQQEPGHGVAATSAACESPSCIHGCRLVLPRASGAILLPSR